MTLQPKCEDVETAEGVAITVTGVAQVLFTVLLHHVYFSFMKHILNPVQFIINAQICQDDCEKPFILVALRRQVAGVLLIPIYSSIFYFALL